MKPDQERLKALLAESVSLMCQNGLNYNTEMRIEGVIGITLDNSDVVLVHINEKHDSPINNVLPKDLSTQILDTSFQKEDDIIPDPMTNGENDQVPSPTPAPTQPAPKTKSPATGKRAGKRSRKQKLTPQINANGEDVTIVHKKTEPVITENNNELIQGMTHTDDLNTFVPSRQMIKAEPMEPISQNGLQTTTTTSTTTYRNSSKSDDDTLAMQQGYNNLRQKEKKTTTPSERSEKSGAPPRKRRMHSAQIVENQQNEAPLVTAPYAKGGVGEEPGDAETGQALAAVSPTWVNPSTPDEGLNVATEQNSPGCSSWSSPSSTNTQQGHATGKSRSQRPSNGLQSTAVKRMLSEYLVEPIAQTDCKVCTFRLMWHGSVQELELIWSRLAYYQDEIDRIITEPAQVALAVSSVTATSTRPKSGGGKNASAGSDNVDKGKTFPGLAYWIVLQNEDEFSETDLYNKIYESSFGARLKTLSDEATASDLQEMCSTLYLVVKDNVDGYVRWKLDSVLPPPTESADGEATGNHPVVKVYARAEQDFKTLLMAKEALQKSRFHFSLLKTDV